MTVTAFIGIGSNLGDREAQIQSALEKLRRVEGVQVLRVSSFIETAPENCPPGSGAFLNGVAKLKVDLPARALLDCLLLIERKLGRDRDGQPANAPRTIDLDLLLYGGQVLNEPGLVVPHPRMHERKFVLWPLLQIESRVIDPRDGHPFADDYDKLCSSLGAEG